MMQNNIKLATIFILGPFHAPFYYLNSIDAKKGDFVEIEFGKRTLTGVCYELSLFDNAEKLASKYGIKFEKIKEISKVLLSSLCSESYLEFIARFSKYNMIPIGTVLEIAIPELILSNKKTNSAYVIHPEWRKKIEDAKSKHLEKIISFCDNFANSIFEYSDVKNSGISKAIFDKAIANSVFEIYNQDKSVLYKEITLNDEQKRASEHLVSNCMKNSVSLINGVTGSGKTQVYMSVITKFIKPNEQVLIMMPEISLTSSLIDGLKRQFGKISCWHSGLKISEKKNTINDIINGNVSIVIGARSSAMLPYKNLRMIIVDEEHDSSYKQDESPVYNARDMSVLRGNTEKFPVLLVSATPSIESYRNSKIGKYKLVELLTRFDDVSMPKIEVIDLKKEKRKKGHLLCESVIKKISEVISFGNQVMIFLNRRGYAKIVTCLSCQYVFSCQNCDSRLTFHKKTNSLKCHYCSFIIEKPTSCPLCHGEDCFSDSIPGIEQLAEEINEHLPDIKAAILSSDESGAELANKIEMIKNGEFDVIIGTQIASKGHTFPKLQLVVIASIDMGVIENDLRVFEKIYQMLVQVSGRAGRLRGVTGEVLIQTFNTKNVVLEAIVSQDQEKFYHEELERRKLANLPPFSRQINIIISSENQLSSKKCAADLSRAIDQKISSIGRNLVSKLGPSESMMHLLKRKYRYTILIQSNNSAIVKSIIEESIKSIKQPSDVYIKTDVDPYNFL